MGHELHKCITKAIAIWILLYLIGFVIGGKSPVVELPLGKIQGYLKESLGGREYYAFEGIPYAKPPIGKHRFKEPIPPKPWNGVLKTNIIHTCIQLNHLALPGHNPVQGDEDCLYVNVYTPDLNPKANLDVILYIHGGAFMFNYGGMMGSQYLLDRNVIYVNINYRLGPMGFLSTEDDLVPGNNGMKDQQLAMKWVRDNVKHFGGNPNSITIMGMSAGGASVHFHYFSPKSKGLFHSGFAQSGCMLNSWVLMEEPLETTKKLAKIVGCSNNDKKEMVACLRQRHARDITAAIKEFQPWLYNPYSPWGIVVDKWASDPVLPEHPYIMLKKKQIYDVPLLSSHVSSEGLYPAAEFYLDKNLEQLREHWDEYMPHILHYNFSVDPSLLKTVSHKIKNEYLKGKELSKSTYKELVQLVGDRLFVADIEKATRLHAAAVSSSIYHYRFDYRGSSSISDRFVATKEDLGVSHADDTNYILHMGPANLKTEKDKKISELLLNMLEGLAKVKRPLAPIEWPPVSKNLKDDFIYIVIKSPDNIFTESSSTLGNRKFWESLPFKENEFFEKTKDEL